MLGPGHHRSVSKTTDKMVLQVDGELVGWVPSVRDETGLEVFFQEHPAVCRANLQLASMPHTRMWRERVLFLRQRMQATSDFRENHRVRWIGIQALPIKSLIRAAAGPEMQSN